MLQFTTRTVWVELWNVGGRTWKQVNPSNGKGRVHLYATNTSGTATRVSTFAASDWPYNYSPGKAETNNVTPTNYARFQFNLYASTTGSFNERFNLAAFKVNYTTAPSTLFFDYQSINNYSIAITVNHCC